MDDWNSNPQGGLSWRLYVVVGFFAIVALVVAVAYVMSRVAPSR
jgi:hypothetical protein